MTKRTNTEGLPPLTEAQLQIMNVVWDRGECTVNEVLQGLNRGLARNTVLTLMTRLAEKGWLVSFKRGREFSYRASVDKAETQRGLARRLVDAAFGGCTEGLVMALVEDGALTDAELTAIRETIERAQEETVK